MSTKNRYNYAIVRINLVPDAFWQLVIQDKDTARCSADGRAVIKRLASEPMPPQVSLVSILDHNEVLGEMRGDPAWSAHPNERWGRPRDEINAADQVQVQLD